MTQPPTSASLGARISGSVPPGTQPWSLLDLSAGEQWKLIEATRDPRPVTGFTHNYYRYPARFPPQMVRAVIEAFTHPGDLVLDPFSGGATTLVEALACGRSAIGTDISSLATFIGQVKTTLLCDEDLHQLKAWATGIAQEIRMNRPEPEFTGWAEAGYFKHLGLKRYWRIRKSLAQSVASTSRCSSPEMERFARCTILRAAQWALDGRRTVPSVEEFREALLAGCEAMLAGMRELRNHASQYEGHSVACYNRSAVGLEEDETLKGNRPRLVITSPPYPGVHVLYHRWQVGGGKETGTPFWIANSLDGSGGSYYTMGDRKRPGLDTYFETIAASMTSVASVCADDAIVVQVVAFSKPEWQLPRYLETVAQAGFIEVQLPVLAGEVDGRLWRQVPNRRWHATQKGETAGSNEVMLFHRLTRYC